MKKRFEWRRHELWARQARHARQCQQGFTLLELLVGVVIVSILLATASQYYFHQRRKGWVAQVRASVRHMAGAQNYFVFAEGAPTFTNDLDDLYLVGYRWDESSVRPYVALATSQTYCVQVHSAQDPTIVWHFSSTVGYPQEGPATPADCGDPQVLGTYIAGLPPETLGRDGRPSAVASGSTTLAYDPTIPGAGAARDGESSQEEGEFGPPGSADGSTTGLGGDPDGPGMPGAGGTTGVDPVSTTGSTPGYGTTDPTSGTVPDPSTSGSTTPTAGGSPSGGSPSGGTSSGSCDGSTDGGSTSGANHPSGQDRDTENGGSGSQGSSGSDPDGDDNGGSDKPGEGGGANSGDQDGNNGSGNDTDFEDDNRGPTRDGSSTPGTGCS